MKIYRCANCEHDTYDNHVIYCNSKKSGWRTCESGRYVYSQQFCPFYEQGKLQGDWEPDSMEIEESEQFKNYIEKQKKNDLKVAQQLIQKWTT